MEIEPADGLQDGVDIYDALTSMVSEAGFSLDDFDVPGISEEIAKIDPVHANQFRNGAELLEQRQEAEAEKRERDREVILLPYRETIDRYVLRFSEEPLRHPRSGSAYGSRRIWIKRFIEDYVIGNGALPTGEHDICIQSGGSCCSGGKHDFSDL